MSTFTIVAAFLLLAACAQARNCKSDRLGGSYSGKVAKTVSGKTCQNWISQTPHEHPTDGSTFPEGNLEDAKNFCRNPDNGGVGPWCYTTDPDTKWENCKVPLCKTGSTSATKNCYNGDGWDYIGKVKTAEGYDCQFWTSQSPNTHDNGDDEKFPEFSASAAKNYCRNPDGSDRPWCYLNTSEKRWAYCDIPEC